LTLTEKANRHQDHAQQFYDNHSKNGSYNTKSGIEAKLILPDEKVVPRRSHAEK